MKFRWPVVRDIVLFLGGFAGVLHETLVVNVDRPTLLILFAAMMGMPAFFHPVGQSQQGPPSPPGNNPSNPDGGSNDETSI